MNNKDKIVLLNERQKCRDKVSVWFGSRDNFIHPLKECIANSIDEISNNFDGGEIEITVNGDMVTVRDTGRGINIGGETSGIKNYEALLLTLFAGTNYSNGENEKIATGTNGVGLTVTNYCSTYFGVQSRKSDKTLFIDFENGGDIKTQLITKKEKNIVTGTTISYSLDRDVFGDYKYDNNEIRELINDIAGVTNNIKFIYKFNDCKVLEFKYDSKLEYFKSFNLKNTCSIISAEPTTIENIVIVPSQGKNKMIEVIEKDIVDVLLTTSSETKQKTFLNNTCLNEGKEGGTIAEGIYLGVRDFVNSYIEKEKMISKKLGKVSKKDVEDSISFVCTISSTVVEFSNQTKLSTNKTLYKTIMVNRVKEFLNLEAILNSNNTKKFVKHILEVQGFNNKANNERKKLKASLNKNISDGVFTNIEGLVDCSEHGESSELFIAEGKSALGSIILSRNSKFQAGIPIRGKITNVLKKSITEILNSPTVMALVRALGCGIETDKKNKDLGDFNEDALRYGKIMIATDMDSDGYQIQCLLLTMFYKLMPKLLSSGRVYIVNTPLYEVRLKDDTDIYWYSEKEKEDYINKYGDINISHMARVKGLGELDAEVMAYSGVNPETRNITQVKVEDVEAMIKSFDKWLGEDVTDRKAIIENELNKYRIEN